MISRRRFVGAVGLPAVAAASGVTFAPRLGCATTTPEPPRGLSPREIARDEDYWAEVARAFTVDYYATSLHKWLFAPHGTGLLYVRRERIADLWPLQAAPDTMADDIRKFEEIGTHPAANFLAVAEALTFHEGIGGARKEARLVYLRDRWANRLLESDRVRLLTSLKPGFACGIATVAVDGIEPASLGTWLWSEHRILVTPIDHEECPGLRISPSVYTTPEELDRFCDAVEHAIRYGIPA